MNDQVINYEFGCRILIFQNVVYNLNQFVKAELVGGGHTRITFVGAVTVDVPNALAKEALLT